MDVTVTFHGFAKKRQEVSVPEGATADDLLKALDIPSELVLVFRDKTPIPPDETLLPGDNVRILRVVSGG